MKGIIFVLAVLVAVNFSGCTTMEGPTPGSRVDAIEIKMNSVGILDKSLQKKIAVESTGSRRTPTGTLEVWNVLRNRTNYQLQLEGRVQFFDKDKAPVEGPTAWQRLILSPNSVLSYKEFSTNVMDIAYYYVEIREGR